MRSLQREETDEATGIHVLTDLSHVDRGYADLAGDLTALGADVERVDMD